jgi:hypothetical protein
MTIVGVGDRKTETPQLREAGMQEGGEAGK